MEEVSNSSDCGPATSTLSSKQVERLEQVLEEDFEIHGRGNFPTLHVCLRSLVQEVRKQLVQRSLDVRTIKLNGGAASHVVASSNNLPYSDVDLIYPIDLKPDNNFELVKQAVLDALAEFMPTGTNRNRISPPSLQDAYIRKMIKVTENGRWSLFSLNNDYGRCVELKFVDQMRRQFEFSVDSFQITLDNLLTDSNEGTDEDGPKSEQKVPKVSAESMYGDFAEALRHLNKRLIDTTRPEEIRGGGLMKYCHLLVRGYRAARASKCKQLERYMCSRFFIDFPDVRAQEAKLCGYLNNHFGRDPGTKYEYLTLLYRVVCESTVCLMGHERRQTLEMIDRLAYQLSVEMHYQQNCLRDQRCRHHPRQTLLFMPRNATYWVPVL